MGIVDDIIYIFIETKAYYRQSKQGERVGNKQLPKAKARSNYDPPILILLSLVFVYVRT